MGAQRLLFYIKQNTLWGLSTVSEEFSVLTAMDKKLTIQSIFYPPAIHFYLHPMYVLSLDEARPASDSMWILNRRSGRQSPGQWLWKNYTVGPVCKETPHNSPLVTGVLEKRWIRILLLLSGWLHGTMVYPFAAHILSLFNQGGTIKGGSTVAVGLIILNGAPSRFDFLQCLQPKFNVPPLYYTT